MIALDPAYDLLLLRPPEPVVDLAEKLLEIAPVKMSKVFFANSGSEANDTVVKLVWFYNNALGRPEKKKAREFAGSPRYREPSSPLHQRPQA